MEKQYKFYAEIINPINGEVLWHYYINCPTKKDAKEFATNQFIKEQSNNLLLDTGGAFMVTVEETE